nr:MAG TPA: hypothetical protein [Caudoviricetes sp.]
MLGPLIARSRPYVSSVGPFRASSGLWRKHQMLRMRS